MNVLQVQCLLAYLGYDPGKIDGLDGANTQKAVRAFQGDFGITADGIAGEATQKALRHAVAYGMPEREAEDAPATGDKPSPVEAEKYLQADGCYHIPRGVDVRLSKNLMAHEVHGQGKGCCQESIISKRMVETYQAIRDEYGEAIEIATAGGSGYRCETHNREVGGASGSLHKLGCAFDMHCRDKAKLLRIVERHITDGEIGVYATFIHAGVWDRGYVNRFNGK